MAQRLVMLLTEDSMPRMAHPFPPEENYLNLSIYRINPQERIQDEMVLRLEDCNNFLGANTFEDSRSPKEICEELAEKYGGINQENSCGDNTNLDQYSAFF